MYRWIAEGDRVLGGIALRQGRSDYMRWAGHLGYEYPGLRAAVGCRNPELASGVIFG
jgi:hypothetical protein